MKILRHFLLTCAALSSGASGVVAFDTSPCFEPNKTADEIVSALSIDGWVSAKRENDKVIDHLAWMGMPQYFLGDKGGSSLAQTLEIKYLAAKGIWNKKELATSKTRILQRLSSDQTEVARIIWTKITAEYTTISCTFSLVGSSLPGSEDSMADLGPLENFTRLNIDYPQTNDTQTFATLIAVNRKKLSDTLKIDVPVDAIIETDLGFWTKEN